jgi:hypothetical protein
MPTSEDPLDLGEHFDDHALIECQVLTKANSGGRSHVGYLDVQSDSQTDMGVLQTTPNPIVIA